MNSKILEIIRRVKSNHYVMSKHINEAELYSEIRADFLALAEYIMINEAGKPVIKESLTTEKSDDDAEVIRKLAEKIGFMFGHGGIDRKDVNMAITLIQSYHAKLCSECMNVKQDKPNV